MWAVVAIEPLSSKQRVAPQTPTVRDSFQEQPILFPQL